MKISLFVISFMLINSTYGQTITNKNISGKEKSLQAVLDKTVDGKKIFGTSYAIKKDSSYWIGASGNISSDQNYFIASTTKLFTTAIILHLKQEGKLNLDDKISTYLDTTILNGLHIYKGRIIQTNLPSNIY